MKMRYLSYTIFIVGVVLSFNSYGDLKKESVSSGLDPSQCPQIGERSWNFEPYAKCHFVSEIGGTERGCQSFVDENGKPISPTFYVDYKPGTK